MLSALKKLENIWKFRDYDVEYAKIHFMPRDFLMFSVGLEIHFPANIYLIKVNNRNTSKRYEICFKLTIKYQKDVNFTPFSSVSSVHFEQINVNWAVT